MVREEVLEVLNPMAKIFLQSWDVLILKELFLDIGDCEVGEGEDTVEVVLVGKEMECRSKRRVNLYRVLLVCRLEDVLIGML